jgi:lipopolysaccharide export system permease protein
MIKIIDKFIIRKFVGSYVFVAAILVTVVIIIQITEKNEYIIQHQLSFKEVFLYMLDFIPYIANLITPITVFIAVVFITAKMASHTEIIAILSSGISFRRLMLSYLYGAVIIAMVNFYLTTQVIPKANKRRIAFEMQYFEKPFYFNDRDIHIRVAPESYLYMETFNNQSKVGYKLTLETIHDQQLFAKLSAQRAQWKDETNSWELRQWELRKFDGFNEKFTRGDKLDTVINLTPRDFDNQWRLFETLTQKELNEHIALLKSRGSDNVIVYETEKYIRLISPFTVILLTFIGLIVSARKSRGGTGFQIALGFLIAFIYILFFWFSKTFAEAGGIQPSVAIWIPNIIFIFVGIILYKFIPR